MTRIGIELDLDVSKLVSNANRARGAIAAITDEMKKAEKEGRIDDYGKLAYEKEKLSGRTAAFERIHNVTANTPNDSAQASLIAGTNRIPPASAPRTQEPFPQPGTPVRQGIGKMEDLTGGFLSSKEAMGDILRDLNKQIEKAKGTDSPNLGKLYFAREKLTATSTGFNRDVDNMLKSPKLQQIVDKQTTGSSLTKSEERYITELDALNTSLRKNTEALLEASKTGNTDDLLKHSSQASAASAGFKKISEQMNAPAGLKGAATVIGMNQIAGVIADGFNRYVGSLDRSGIINQYGSGDILGGRVSEKQREANLYGGTAQSVLGTVGMGLMMAPHPVAKVAGAGVSLIGQLANGLFQADVKEESNEAAYAGLWQQRSSDAMQLAALQGRPNDPRGSWRDAAGIAEKHGYTSEEGMDVSKEAAMQGLGIAAAKAITDRVFQHERSTGADRGTMTSLSTMSARYGGGDALRAGWAGLGASGMKMGQYTEYLRAMQKVMEDGISKGFIRSSDQVAKNLTMLAQLADNSPMWQGEQGARRLMEMNSGLEQATGLRTASDIIAFRSFRDEKDPDYIDAMTRMEKGLDVGSFKKFMGLTENIEGEGNRAGVIERMRQTFGLNYTNALKLYDGYKGKDKEKGVNDEAIQALIDSQKNIPNSGSDELKAAIVEQSTVNWWAKTGQHWWEQNLGKLGTEYQNAVKNYNKTTGKNEPVPENPFYPHDPYPPKINAPPVTDTSLMAPTEAVNVRQSEYAEAIKNGGTFDEIAAAARRVTEAQAMAHEEAFTPPVNPESYPVRMGRTLDMLTQKKRGGRATFFTGNGLPWKNDDEKAFGRLMEYEQQPDNSPANQAFWKAIAMLEQVPADQRRQMNEADTLNSKIPSIATDPQGIRLLEQVRDAILDLDITVIEL